MSRRNSFASRRLGLESLESRQLLAGNVFVTVDGGDLIVTGDARANEIQILQALQNGEPIPGQYVITGLNNTTINNQPADRFTDVTDDFIIKLNGGNDILAMGNGTTADFVIPDDLEIDTAEGNDVLRLDRIDVGDDATINTGNGADSLSMALRVGFLPRDNGDNSLFINTGARSDNVLLRNTFVRADLSINTGPDQYADTVDMLMMNIGDDTTLNTGGGDDTVRMSDVGVNDDFILLTGAGSDRVTMNRCEVDEFFADLGAGRDRLELRDTFGRRATLNGGADGDGLLRVNSPFNQFFQANSF
jgi:hypothetical protein